MKSMSQSITMVLAALTALLTGCASVPMASVERDTAAKSFAVKPDKANIYVYRNETIGSAIKMPVALNGKLVGDTGPTTYMVLEVPPGTHTILSKTENDSTLTINAVGGRNYFVWQEVKMGMFAARSALQQVDEAKGKAGVAECKLIEVKQ
jgi:PBP1b-binding outer membrane lipoprotein LpoB